MNAHKTRALDSSPSPLRLCFRYGKNGNEMEKPKKPRRVKSVRFLAGGHLSIQRLWSASCLLCAVLRLSKSFRSTNSQSREVKDSRYVRRASAVYPCGAGRFPRFGCSQPITHTDPGRDRSAAGVLSVAGRMGQEEKNRVKSCLPIDNA